MPTAVQTVRGPVMVGNPFFADEKPDYLLISREVLPALRAAGVAPETIEQIDDGQSSAFFQVVVPHAQESRVWPR
jgi:hypothetical protein